VFADRVQDAIGQPLSGVALHNAEFDSSPKG
jgi:hypothetical protein